MKRRGGGGMFRDGEVDSGRVAHINWLKKGVYSGREHWVDSGRVAHINWLKRGYILGGRVDSGIRRHLSRKGGYILGGIDSGSVA